MSENELDHNHHDELDAEIRALVARPPHLPAEQLAGVLAPRLRDRQHTPWRLAAALLVTLGGGLASWWSWPTTPTPPPSPPVVERPLASRQHIVLLPLDDGTPLYLALAPN